MELQNPLEAFYFGGEIGEVKIPTYPGWGSLSSGIFTSPKIREKWGTQSGIGMGGNGKLDAEAVLHECTRSIHAVSRLQRSTAIRDEGGFLRSVS
jgi:hypothetical protein